MTEFPAGAPSDGSNAEAGAASGEPVASASSELLQRLAAALGLPVGVFMEQASGIAFPSVALMEASSLLTAFSRITCPAARRRCIDMVEAAGRPEDAP